MIWWIVGISILVILLGITMYHCSSRGDSSVVAAIIELVVDVISAVV